MQLVTLIIAVLASLLILGLRPIYGLAVYFVVLFGWSQRLTVALGPLDFTTARIVILVLIARAALDPGLRGSLRVTAMDGLVLVSYLGVVAALAMTTSPAIWVIRESGTLVDTLLPYAAVRLIVRDRRELVTMVKALAVVGIPLALLGIYQSVTGHNPAGFMAEHFAWGMAREVTWPQPDRWGLHRATVTFGHPITFGLFFAAVAPLVLGMPRRGGGWSLPTRVIVAGAIAAGAFVSLSSAPLFALVAGGAFLCCYPVRRLWPAVLAGLVLSVLFVEIYSNRNFYHVLTRLAFRGPTAYYRIGLWEEAWGGGMDGHWLAGYGYVGVGPGVDNTNFHWHHKDLVNIYIGRMARYGMLGLLPFLALNAWIYVSLVKAGRRARAPADLWMTWSLAAALVGWNLGFMTVAALEHIQIMLYMLIGVAANMPMIMARANAAGREEWVVVVRRRGADAGPALPGQPMEA